MHFTEFLEFVFFTILHINTSAVKEIKIKLPIFCLILSIFNHIFVKIFVTFLASVIKLKCKLYIQFMVFPRIPYDAIFICIFQIFFISHCRRHFFCVDSNERLIICCHVRFTPTTNCYIFSIEIQIIRIPTVCVIPNKNFRKKFTFYYTKKVGDKKKLSFNRRNRNSYTSEQMKKFFSYFHQQNHS